MELISDQTGGAVYTEIKDLPTEKLRLLLLDFPEARKEFVQRFVKALPEK